MDKIFYQAFIDNNYVLSVHDFMALNNRLYYQKGAALGPQGDFITAPEVSPLLGEIIGLSLVDSWQRLGEPCVFDLIECGPGRGLLMQDILRITAPFKSFHQALSLKFIDINPSFSFHAPHRLFTTLKEALENRPTFFIANEFFDAFAIEQHIFKEGKPIERFVNYHSSKLAFSYDEHEEIIETCPEGQKTFETIATHLYKSGGVTVIIDYGHALKEAKGSTLQSLSKNQVTCPLAYPGAQDLTAHVNFYNFISHLKSLDPPLQWTFETQRFFLLARGAYHRLQQVLSSGMPLEKIKNYYAAFERLTDPRAMGTLFKVLWIESAPARPIKN